MHATTKTPSITPSLSSTFHSLDTRARKWHSTMLDKKKTLESHRKSSVTQIVQKLDTIAKSELEIFSKEHAASPVNIEETISLSPLVVIDE